MTDAEPTWSDWGPPLRVQVEADAIAIFARALHDDNELFRSDAAAARAGFRALPAPPTFSFVMSHSGAHEDLQPPEGRGRLGPPSAGDAGSDPMAAYARDGMYLHGEQHFTYHRQPVAGDVLEGRMRVSEPMTKSGSRGTMEITFMDTEWRDLGGAPVVSERIVSIFIPSA
ncbi:MAG: FAS1-like dehydratase domain-containing protein [Acidimicrobiia bacterium]